MRQSRLLRPGRSRERALVRPAHGLGQSHRLQRPDGDVDQVDFPPAVAVSSRARVGMVVVVPALAVGDKGNEPIVAALLPGVVGAVAPQMSQGVH